MAEYEREHQVVRDKTREKRANLQKVVNFIWLLIVAIQIIIGLRVFLKLIAANEGVAFTQFIYTLSDAFVWPFVGITITPSANGIVFDIPAIVAMIVYGLGGWLLASLIWTVFKPTRAETVVRSTESEMET